MNRADVRRTAGVAAIVALVLVAAGCGQKAGVGGQVAGEAGLTEGVSEDGFSDSLDGTSAETGTDGAAAGEAPAARRGAGPAAGGDGEAAGGDGEAAAGPTGPLDRTGISDTEIKIGIHAPESGAAPVSSFREGVGVYAQFAGKIPGLGNRQIVVEARDDKFDPAEARRVCKELVEVEKVFLLIGGAGVDQIKSCAEYAASAGVPYFSPGVTEGPFRGLANYFALSETYNQQNVQIGQLIKNQIKKSKLGIVTTDSPLLNETVDNMKEQAAKNGLQVVYEGKLAKNAGKGQTDAVATDLKKEEAEVVYALISPTVFGFLVSSAKQQQYNPVYTAPGLSLGVNLVAGPICAAPPPTLVPDVRVFSPMVQMDVIDAHDADYQPAYRQKNPGKQPDDVGILLWGLEKTMRLMMEADGPDLSRQTLMQALSDGKPFESNVYAPVKYGGVPHFGASSVTLLRLDCSAVEYKTVTAFGSQF